MSMNMDNLRYWHTNQLAIAFPYTPTHTTATLKADLNAAVQFQLTDLNNRVLQNTPFTLTSFVKSAAKQPQQQTALQQNTADLDGVYLFGSFTNTIGASREPHILAFCKIEHNDTVNTMPGRQTMPGNDMSNDDMADNTLTVIDHLKKDNQHPVTATPHWFWSGTPGIIHGCPISPPFPVTAANTPGRWKITLPQLSDSTLQNATGKGVTVFVLDTMPSSEQIQQAALKAGDNNPLLQQVIENVTFTDRMSYALDLPDLDQVATGKDAYGQLVGFPMTDHGIFIAGIIQDLAPEAKIECIRVLNDYGVGDTNTLIATFGEIQQRMESGDLQNTPVVINLSLVVLPPVNDTDTAQKLSDDTLQLAINTLREAMQKLADQGAIFAASAGNDSDPRDKMNKDTPGKHLEPRYPAKLAFGTSDIPNIIPIGAVNGSGQAASYSNNPGSHGIATYGGEIPEIEPAVRPAANLETVKVVPPIDALCGIYTASQYPALVMDSNIPLSLSADYPEYPATSTNAWAYWAGTSFATPIISALAARFLESQAASSPGPNTNVDIRQHLISIATQHTALANAEPDDKGENWPVIMATQAWMPEDASVSQ
ncbi:MAG: hypothetical protein NVS4B7_01400 [Ktedonobacteraceae bacterium]